MKSSRPCVPKRRFGSNACPGDWRGRAAAGLALTALLAGANAATTSRHEAAMLRLAARSGCSDCHALEPGTSPTSQPGLPPVGPAWRDVAAKYRGDTDAQARLTQTVLAGSDPYNSHWKDKVAGLAMPANQVVVRPADARRLVRWILALPDAAAPR